MCTTSTIHIVDVADCGLKPHLHIAARVNKNSFPSIVIIEQMSYFVK